MNKKVALFIMFFIQGVGLIFTKQIPYDKV